MTIDTPPSETTRATTIAPAGAIRVSLVNDYEIIVRGLAAMLAPFADRVRVVEMEVEGVATVRADIALFDTFAGRRYALERSAAMVAGRAVRHVVIYTWDASPTFLGELAAVGVSGVILKSKSGAELVELLERVATGERIGFEHPVRGPRERRGTPELTEREREVLAMLATGISNRQIADELYLSVDTVKTYARRVYAKLGVANRAQAAVRAIELELAPPAR